MKDTDNGIIVKRFWSGVDGDAKRQQMK